MNVGCHIKKDDKVRIISGKDRGKVGKIIRIISKKNKVVIENVNLVKKHVKPSAQNRQGGIVETEAPIHCSNVMIVCSKCIKPVRSKVKFLGDGKKVRICNKCGEIVDG